MQIEILIHLHLYQQNPLLAISQSLIDLVQTQNVCEVGRTYLKSGRHGHVYVGSADTTVISAELPKHLQNSFSIQRVLGSYLAGLTHLYLHWLLTFYALCTTSYVMTGTHLVLTTCATAFQGG